MPGGLRFASLHSGPSHYQMCRTGSKLPVRLICQRAPPPTLVRGWTSPPDSVTISSRKKVQQFQFGHDYPAAVKGFKGSGVNSGSLAGAVEFSGKFVGADAIYAFGGKKRSHLLLFSKERREGGTDGFGRNVLKGEGAVYLLFKVVGRGGGTKTYARYVLFVVVLQFLGAFAGIADTNQQHARCQRVQGAGMANFQVFLPEVLDGGVLEFTDYIGRCPPVRLIHRKDYSVRVI